jgi:PIN domain nuclease of toxin-antitoxin system
VTRLLLDTHAFLWFITDDDRLTTRDRHAIIDADHALVSIASCWEIAIKASLGKLTLSAPPDRLLAEQLAENSFDLLHIDLAHISRVAALPWHHRDPFDRLLVAQALDEKVPIASSDPIFKTYGVKRLW